jgi:phosphoadenosine phosphosulfate reductase
MELNDINRSLAHKNPFEITEWAMMRAECPIVSSSFGPASAAMLYVTSKVAPNIPVIWVDHGYNLPETYQHVETLVDRLKLNLQVYTPKVTFERRRAIFGGVPMPEDEDAFRQFANEVKVEPFERALKERSPDYWLTGISKYETAHRASLDVVSVDHRGVTKVAPFFHWKHEAIDAFIAELDLPAPNHYFDPTKLAQHMECGLHVPQN